MTEPAPEQAIEKLVPIPENAAGVERLERMVVAIKWLTSIKQTPTDNLNDIERAVLSEQNRLATNMLDGLIYPVGVTSKMAAKHPHIGKIRRIGQYSVTYRADFHKRPSA